MFTVKDKFLGKFIGLGGEHIVYAKNDKYVYKVFIERTKNIFTLIKIVRLYLDSRNTIPYQLPCKFVGISFWDGYMYPIFKQRRAEPLPKNCEIPNEYMDAKRANYGIYEGKVVAIDIYKYRVHI